MVTHSGLLEVTLMPGYLTLTTHKEFLMHSITELKEVIQLSKNLSLILRFHGQLSMNNGDPNVKGGFGVYSNNQQFIAYNAELAYKFTNNFGVKGYYESGGAGKNIISAAVFNVGLFFTN